MTPAPARSGPSDGILKLAIMAVGGQGGGVLTNWIVDLAEANGWHAQSTAVAGVAQRTGATFYYIEMARDEGRAPVFALAPSAGDVDVLIAAEWREAGRAVQRGFVTPDRTTVVASTHKVLAVAEKIVPGDGVRDGEPVARALGNAAARVVAFDMMAPAVAAGSVVSATLFGALAASGTLPFARAAFEQTIRRGGRGVEASLAAFGAGWSGAERSDDPPVDRPEEQSTETVSVPARLQADWDAQLARTAAWPDTVREIARAGLVKTCDFQDLDYARTYLDRVAPFVETDRTADHQLGAMAAKHIANAMAYDDVIRVADLKIRSHRMARVDAEMQRRDRPIHLTEFMHPRIEEVCGTLPAGIGRWIEARPRLYRWLDRRINRGRRVRTDTIRGFLQLYCVASLRRWRPGSLRHAVEVAHCEHWLALAKEAAAQDQRLAAEILACRRLVKGYSDTHARGASKFDRVLSALPALAGRDDAADWIRRLREAALQDEEGAALDGALRTIASFTPVPEPEPAL